VPAVLAAYNGRQYRPVSKTLPVRGCVFHEVPIFQNPRSIRNGRRSRCPRRSPTGSASLPHSSGSISTGSSRSPATGLEFLRQAPAGAKVQSDFREGSVVQAIPGLGGREERQGTSAVQAPAPVRPRNPRKRTAGRIELVRSISRPAVELHALHVGRQHRLPS